MKEIINESEFLRYMVVNGPDAKKSRGNYISWLRFVSTKYRVVNQNLTKVKVENTAHDLISTIPQRDKYDTEKDVYNIKSALNKYLQFVGAENSMADVASDIISIVGDENKHSARTEIETRLGHGKYRIDLVELWGKCSVTELAKTDLLIASHIKPWRVSENEEKIDKYNGLLLVPNFDKIFDKGYITFKDDGIIILSELLTDEQYSALGISKESKLYKVFEENKKYLKFHRENIFMR